MCGIAGAYGYHLDVPRDAVAAMCSRMHARGPDDGGLEVFEEVDLALGARRLSIIDPSPAGHQPMIDKRRETTIVFNGMIYNFEELRQQLLDEGETFTSHCDTEVVLKAYGRWGADCVRRLRGMFAFGIWDGRQRELFLARDRLGIKPLYYWHRASQFLFASQVKALLSTNLVPAQLSHEGIETFLDFGAVSEPLTAIDGVLALPAAHYGVFRDGALTLRRYWDFPATHDLEMSRGDAKRTLRTMLDEAVERHLVSDVSIGVFLSGGIDSSVIAALAARHTPNLCTVSVVFDEQAYSEEPYIAKVVDRIGGEHVPIVLKPLDLLEWSKDAFDAMDQPSVDALNTYVVSRAAKRVGLKVALSGLGGDELFDGYGHLRRIRMLERARSMPSVATRVAARAASALLGHGRGAKTGEWLSANSLVPSSYELLRRLFLPGEVRHLMNGVNPQASSVDRSHIVNGGRDLYGQLSILELTNYTKNILLRDTDGMSMENSLEVRVPYLDHEVVEWVLRLPPALKAGRGKALLVEAVEDILPAEILTRKKHGFTLPLGVWTAGELKTELEEVFRDLPLSVAGLVRPDAIEEIWSRYLNGRVSWHRPWALYALAKWAQTLVPTTGELHKH